MTRMVPTIVRFEATLPDSAELRYYLRHAACLLAASDVDTPARIAVLRRARAWMTAAIAGVDEVLRVLDPAVSEAVVDRDTEAHDLSNLELPTLVASRRGGNRE